jgi:hypothetical protein
MQRARRAHPNRQDVRDAELKASLVRRAAGAVAAGVELGVSNTKPDQFTSFLRHDSFWSLTGDALLSSVGRHTRFP